MLDWNIRNGWLSIGVLGLAFYLIGLTALVAVKYSEAPQQFSGASYEDLRTEPSTRDGHELRRPLPQSFAYYYERIPARPSRPATALYGQTNEEFAANVGTVLNSRVEFFPTFEKRLNYPLLLLLYLGLPGLLFTAVLVVIRTARRIDDRE